LKGSRFFYSGKYFPPPLTIRSHIIQKRSFFFFQLIDGSFWGISGPFFQPTHTYFASEGVFFNDPQTGQAFVFTTLPSTQLRFEKYLTLFYTDPIPPVRTSVLLAPSSDAFAHWQRSSFQIFFPREVPFSLPRLISRPSDQFQLFLPCFPSGCLAGVFPWAGFFFKFLVPAPQSPPPQAFLSLSVGDLRSFFCQ